MRITCEKCFSPYAIDDRLVRSGGVKAQCPKCRNVQVVRAGDTAETVVDDSLLGLAPAAAGAPRCPKCGGEYKDAFDEALGECESCRERSRAPLYGAAAPAPSTATISDLFGQEDVPAEPPRSKSRPPLGPSSGAASARHAAAAASEPARPKSRPPLGPVASESARNRSDGTGSRPPLGPVAADSARTRPDGTGSRPPLGPVAADSARTRSEETGSRPPLGPDRASSRSGAGEGRAAFGDAPETTRTEPAGRPVFGAGLLGRMRPPREAGAFDREVTVPGSDLPPPQNALGDLFGPEPTAPRGAPLPPEPAPPPRSISRSAISAARSESSPSLDLGSLPGGLRRPRNLLLPIFGGMALLAVAFGWYVQHAQAEERARAAASPPIHPAIAKVLPTWRMTHVDVTGTADAHLADATRELEKDTPEGYANAEAEYQKALLLEPNRFEAVAGYVNAIALGQGEELDDELYSEAESLLAAAADGLGKDDPRLLVARANLLLTREQEPGRLDQARALAQQAVEAAKGDQRAMAYLALGRTFVASSAGLAVQYLDQALQAKPLPLALYHRAVARAAAGQFRAATSDLEGRLKGQSHKHVRTLAALAEIYEDLGEGDRARKLYEEAQAVDPSDTQTALALAVHCYQFEGKPAEAAAALRARAAQGATLRPKDLVSVLVHLAAAERIAGRLDAAEKAATDALAISRDEPAAQFQRLLIALQRKDAAAARARLGALSGRLNDAAQEKVLEGKILLLEKKDAEANAAFNAAATLDGRRADALVLAGYAAARAGNRNEVARVLFKAAESDPTRTAPRRLPTRFFVGETELLRGVDGAVLGLSGSSEDVMPRLYEGVVRYRQGDRAAAVKLFSQALALDPENAVAQAYLGLGALERGNAAEARLAGEHAVASGRQVAMGHYVLGLALARANQNEAAAKALRDAQALAPSWPSIVVALAELEAKGNSVPAARSRLEGLVTVDPSYLPAKRALYALEK